MKNVLIDCIIRMADYLYTPSAVPKPSKLIDMELPELWALHNELLQMLKGVC